MCSYIPGQGLFVLNLTAEHQHLLQLLGKRYKMVLPINTFANYEKLKEG